MKRGFGSVLTALLFFSGPAVAFAAFGDNSLTRTNIFAPSGYLPATDYWRLGAIFGLIFLVVFMLSSVPLVLFLRGYRETFKEHGGSEDHE